MTTGPSCWDCTYHQTGGSNLLGFCRWFVVKQNQGAKAIPPEIVDKGCALHERAGSHPLVPHFHNCKVCPDRHRWECRNNRCVWNVVVDCGVALQPDFDVTKTNRRPK